MLEFFNKIGWHASIGDPGFMGWFTVFAYFLCAFHAHRVIRYHERIFSTQVQKQLLLWRFIFLFMVLLGINKQLDLQTLFTATMRYLAHKQGWYDKRSELQYLFIVTIAVIGLISMLGLFGYFWKVVKKQAYAIIGLCVLSAFILIRASSFHYMDIFISLEIVGLRMNWILELCGITLILYNARKLYLARRPIVDISKMQ